MMLNKQHIQKSFDGNEQQDLFLRHIPIASITSVTEDGNTLVSR